MISRKVEKILVSQPEPGAGRSPYFDVADKHNVSVTFHPFIKVERLSIKEFRKQHIDILDFTALVFTSRNAVDHFFSICNELKITVPDSMKYFCKSEAIALYLQKYIQYRKRKIFFSETGKIEGLKKDITKHKREKFLLPVPEEHNDQTEEILESCKVNFVKTVMYRTVNNSFDENEKLDYDMIIFFSPLGIQSLMDNFPDFEQGDMAIGCFGVNTAKAVVDAGLRLDCEAPSPEHLSMVSALDAFLEQNHKANS